MPGALVAMSAECSVQCRLVVPSLIFQVAMLPSVIVGDSAGMLKFCAASEAWAGWKAASLLIDGP
jgi:hypothetical protein